MTKTIKKNPDWLRTAGPAGQGATSIDRERGVIRGYSVIQIGPALGHGFDIDRTTLELVTKLGNALPKGTKSRFTHPGMSGDGLGKYLGRSKNFRIEGDRVLADLYLARSAFNTPDGDLATYVMDRAEEDSKSFGASIVAKGDKEHVLNDDGTRKKDKNGDPLPPLYRPKVLHAVDVVDDPAANRDGFLSAEGLPDWHLRQATDVLDHVFGDAPAEVIEARVNAFLGRYFSLRGKTMPSDTKPAAEDTAAEKAAAEKLAAEKLAADKAAADKAAADKAAAEKNSGAGVTLSAADLDAKIAAAAQKAAGETLAAEQKRCRDIVALCAKARLPKLADKFIADNLSVADVNAKLVDELAKENKTLGEDTSLDVEGGGDPDARFKKEYQSRRKELAELGVSEEEHVRSRRLSEGLDTIDSLRAAAASKK